MICPVWPHLQGANWCFLIQSSPQPSLSYQVLHTLSQPRVCIRTTQSGFCYFHGKGVEHDEYQALLRYRQAAEQGHVASRNFLSELETREKAERTRDSEDIESEGRGSDSDPEEMMTLAEEMFARELSEEDKKEVWGKAVKLLDRAARRGHAGAQYKMGTLCCSGVTLGGVVVVKAEPELGVQYFSLAADQGHRGALYQLGVCCSRGVGLDVDKGEAVKYFQLATEKGGQGVGAEGSSCVVS